jgi:Glycosyltransferase family 87
VIARPETWPRLRRRSPPGAVAVALVALAVFLASWALLHVGFYGRDQVRDTPLYQSYGDRIVDGDVPYRDFALEYPPGVLPAFALPSLVAEEGDEGGFRRAFETLMWVAGAVCLLGVVLTLVALDAPPLRLLAATGFVALAPLALGSVLLSRYDLLPAALTAIGLGLFVSGRERVGLGVLGLGAATKVYPALLAPIAVVYLWRRRGRREALVGSGVFVVAAAAVIVPFVAISPGGIWDALTRQADRGLQIESLGSAALLVAHHLGGVGIEMRSSAGSQNLVGTAPDVLAALHTVIQALAVLGIWIAFARGPVDRERLVRASALVVCAFVALGKVASPQFLIWLIPLVPLVRGLRGLAASTLLAAALVLTQLWFPYRYWDLALEFDEPASWLVLARDLVLLALVGVLAWPGREAACPRSGPVEGKPGEPGGSPGSDDSRIRNPNRLAADGSPVVAAFDQDAFDPNSALGRMEADGHPGAHAPDRELGLHADDRVVRAGHAGVRHRRGAAGLHARVGRLHVRVRPDHRGHAAVQPPRQGDLLAGRLGVEVHHDDPGLPSRLGDEVVDDLEEADRRPEEERAEQVDHGHARTVLGGHDDQAAAGRVRGEIGGSHHPVRLVQVRDQFLPAPCVVAQRDRVGAGAEDPLGQLGREARTVGGVLRIDDAEVRFELVPKSAQPVLERPCTRGAEDVGDEENLYGMARVAAGWTSMATWLPASCV